MKRALVIALGVVAALAVMLVYNVWRGETEVLAPQPGPVEQGRQALHAQFEQSAAREAQIEKTYWDHPEKLQVLIQSHQKRVAELDGNPAAGELLAHDKDAITRLQNRITAIAAQRQAEAAQATAAEQAAPGTASTKP
jgi:hypothetical protein